MARTLTFRTALLIGVVMALLLTSLDSEPAAAASGDIFPSGVTYSATTYSGHPNPGGFGDAVDLNQRGGDCNKPLVAPADATVDVHSTAASGSGWGNSVIVTMGSERLFVAHLSSIDRTGRVSAGQTFAKAGATGYVEGSADPCNGQNGAHLHVGRSVNGRPAPVVLSGREITPTRESDYRYTSRGPATTTAGPRYAGTLIRDSSNGRVDLVKADGRRYHVPTGGDYQALVNNGIPLHHVDHATATSMPDSGRQATVHTVDDPAIHDPWGYVTRKTDTHGHAGDRYVTWTTHPGGRLWNHATWNLSQAPGVHRIKAFIPHREASADTLYHVYDGDREVCSPRISQVNIYGWTTLCEHEFTGSRVTVVLRDNEATARNQRLGIDAVQVVPIR